MGANWKTSFLNDIVLDETRSIAYISNAGGKGGIITYNFELNEARALIGPSTAPDPSVGNVRIAGKPAKLALTASDGIALSSDRETLYFCPLSSYHLFSIPTAKLRDFTLDNAVLNAAVVDVGVRPAPSEGIVFSNQGKLYLGGLTTSTLYEWTPGSQLSSMTPLAVNVEELTWIDTFAWDGMGNIIFSTNRLQLYNDDIYDFSRGAPANFRILRLAVGAKSYLDAQPPAPTC